MDNKINKNLSIGGQSVLIFLLIISSLNIYCQTLVTFNVYGLPEDSLKHLGIRGNVMPLSWEQSIQLNRSGSKYSTTIEFQHTDKELEFKFVKYNDDSEANWESTENRTFQIINDTVLTSNSTWNREQIVDINSLKPISSQALLKDFELIQTMILEVHPGTYRYNTKEEIQLALDDLKSSFSQAQTYGEAYLAISKLTAQLKCDHTKAGFNNQNKTINSIIHYQKDKIPFTFKWIDEQMVVLQNASENKLLNTGTIIHAINEIPVIKIRNQLLPFVGADGSTDGNRLYKLEVNGYDFRYNAFDIFYPLIFPLDTIIKLEIQGYQMQERQIIEVELLTRVDRANRLIERYDDFPKSRDDLWSFNLLNDSTAVLAINSFGLYGWKAMKIDYKDYFEKVFTKLDEEAISHLVIDIRKNTGGNDEIANELFNYLTRTEDDFEREGRTRYVKFPESLIPYVQTWEDNPWYFELEPSNPIPRNGYYIFKDNFKSNSKKTNNKLYKGQVYLLTSNANTSLAFYVANNFKLQKLGMIVGQETGGNLNDINGGQILFLRLPNSKIEIDFPVMGGFAIVRQPDNGVKPDIETSYSIEDFVKKRDIEIDSILRIISENK